MRRIGLNADTRLCQCASKYAFAISNKNKGITMALISHSHHLYVMALNPLVGASVKDTIEKVSIYLERLGTSLADQHQDPSIGLVTNTAIAALRYETNRIPETKPAAAAAPATAEAC